MRCVYLSFGIHCNKQVRTSLINRPLSMRTPDRAKIKTSSKGGISQNLSQPKIHLVTHTYKRRREIPSFQVHFERTTSSSLSYPSCRVLPWLLLFQQQQQLEHRQHVPVFLATVPFVDDAPRQLVLWLECLRYQNLRLHLHLLLLLLRANTNTNAWNAPPLKRGVANRLRSFSFTRKEEDG